MKALTLTALLTLLISTQSYAFSPPPEESCGPGALAPPPSAPPAAGDGLAPPDLADRDGLALNHGTRSQTKTTARWEYWTNPNINSIREGLPDPSLYEIIGCDFDQNIWSDDSTGCLAEQLQDFVFDDNITKFEALTHSHGGNMMRWILSVPTFDPNYEAVIATLRWVTALAPSSLGTVLADKAFNGDLVEQALAESNGFKNDAVFQQQRYYMHALNTEILKGTAGRPPLPKGFYAVIGTDATLEIPYCGGNTGNLWFTHQTVGFGDDWCNDGFLTCDSQAGAGIPWQIDKDITSNGRALNHSQSRRDCWGLDLFLRDAL
ncbi:MAG: hypothetical protein AAGM22_32495 [Acidobacteriota bacterium]